jgi:hypothetical protein
MIIPLPYQIDIYHLATQTASKNYGLPSDIKLIYPSVPDLTNISCYYYILENVTEELAMEKITLRYKMIFSINTDIRENDQVIINGEKFRLWKPDKKLNSHIEVVAVRLAQV